MKKYIYIILKFIVVDLVFSTLWMAGNHVSMTSKDYGMAFFLFVLFGLVLMVVFSGFMIFRNIPSKVIRVLLSLLTYLVIFYIFINFSRGIKNSIELQFIIFLFLQSWFFIASEYLYHFFSKNKIN